MKTIHAAVLTVIPGFLPAAQDRGKPARFGDERRHHGGGVLVSRLSQSPAKRPVPPRARWANAVAWSQWLGTAPITAAR